jgi:Type IV secretory pathway, VirD4 components
MYQDVVFVWRSRLSKAGIVLCCLGIFLFPLPGSLALLSYLILQEYYEKKSSKLMILTFGFFLIGVSIFYLNQKQMSRSSIGLLSLIYTQLIANQDGFASMVAYVTADGYFREHFLPSAIQWFCGINLFGWGVGVMIVSFGLLLQKSSSEILMHETVKQETRREVMLNSRGGINFNDKGHVGAFGSTRTGKTATILHYIEQSIREGQFTVVIDGKGGTSTYDLNIVTEKLAKKYNRKLYVINQSEISKTNPYNPFKGITETELKDLLSSLTEWSEEHYRIQALTYWQVMGRVMRAADIQYSFQSIIKYSDPSNFKNLIEGLYSQDIISKELYSRAKQVLASCKDTVVQAIGRLAIFNDGDGRYLFGQDGFTLRQAYEEGAVVVVYLNEFKYSDFARSLGKLVVAEYKLFLSQKAERDDQTEALLVMDELGVYVDESFEALLNRTASFSVKTIVAMQVIADVNKVSEELTKQILGNLTNFVILRTDDDTANELSKFIGTEKQVKQTSRSNEEGNTGESSNNVVDEFVINPNKIKRLPNLHGYYYSHNRPGEPSKFVTTFVKTGKEKPTKENERKIHKKKPERIVLSKK